MSQLVLENHPFAPFIPPQSKYLILDSFPGKEPTQKNPDPQYNWYYGSKRNQFWEIMGMLYHKSFDYLAAKQALFNEKKLLSQIYILPVNVSKGIIATPTLQI